MIICADDYGLNAANDDAILELGRNGKISAISVMVSTNTETRESVDKRLIETAKDRLDTGLHLVLTDEGYPVSEAPVSLLASDGKFCSYKTLVARAYLNMLNKADVDAEIRAQIKVFHNRFGRIPDYIDGHLHIHQLPYIRSVVASISAEINKTNPLYTRNTWEPLRELIHRGLAPYKHAAIALAGLRLKQMLINLNIPTNQGFAGVYDYRRWELFPRYFEKNILPAMTHHNSIIMTHPGHEEAWRRLEFETLRKTRALHPNRFRHA